MSDWDLVVIPCGRRKLTHPAPAIDVYDGEYFRRFLRAARVLARGDDPKVRILSAKHGLIPLTRYVAPYNVRMGEPGSVDVDKVRAQALDQGLLDAERVALLCAHRYADLASQVWPHGVRAFDHNQGRKGLQTLQLVIRNRDLSHLEGCTR